MRWPATGSTPKAADLPAPGPSLPPRPRPAAAEPGTCPDAGQGYVPGNGLDARYEQLRHAALHARAEAFPLGLAVLTCKGITAWRHALTSIAPIPADTASARAPAAATAMPALTPAMASALPVSVTAELVAILAALTVAAA